MNKFNILVKEFALLSLVGLLLSCGGGGGGGDTIAPVAPRAVAWVNGLTQAAQQVYLPIADQNHITELGVQNVSTLDATVIVEFIDSAGNTLHTASEILSAQGSHVFPVETFSAIPPGTTVSAIVNSDQPLVATALLRSPTSEALFGYKGVTSGSTEVHLPLVMRAFLGNQTAAWVQNTGASPANITLTYTPYSVGNSHVMSDTIPVGAARVYNQAAIPELGASFNGRVMVEADFPVTVVVEFTNSANPSYGGAYIGIPIAGNSYVYPYQRKNIAGPTTGTQVVNLGGASANVVADWYHADGSPALTENVALAVGSAYTFYLGALALPEGFDGSLILSADQPLTAVVSENIVSLEDALVNDEAIPSSDLETTLYLPQVARSVSLGLDTGFSLQNPNNDSAQLTVNFYAQDGSLTTSFTDTLPAFGVQRYSTDGIAALGDEWSGALVVSANQPLALAAMHWR